MAKLESQSTLNEIIKKIEVLSSKITAQTTIIEAQNKKLNDQQRVINEMSTNIIEQKRVFSVVSDNIDRMLSSMCASTSVVKLAEVKLVADAPETRPSPTITERAKRATARLGVKAGASGSANIAKGRQKSPTTKSEITANVKASRVPNVITAPVQVNNNKSGTNLLANEDEWTLVSSKGRSRKEGQLKEVQKGGNSKIDCIAAIEKKKYLHVWFLHPDTSVEKITEHVESLCKTKDIKVNKIKPRTAREYSSFLIGVPESSYEFLSKPESWPVHAEFSEWVWFRKSASQTTTFGH